MCRWLAYTGCPVYLEDLLLKPENSLINQSLRAQRSHIATNGDGFGVGWYADRSEPGLYRDLRPAWNDENLRSLSEQIRSALFFAHVRASTGTAASRANCHPFRHQRWMFMHNGQIGNFDRVARDLDFAIAPDYYRARQGTTDSETFFYLLLTHGLDRDPPGALARAVNTVETAMHAAAVTEPFRLTAAFTDGHRIYAVRYSSDRASPTLFYGCGAGIRAADGRDCVEGGDGKSLLILSEPLDTAHEHWTAVDENHLLIAENGQVTLHPFAPATMLAA
ncbi:MAG: class II glutamine amidotransferase [Rhodospirillales bacterium]|nr:class II glutamine amidotransferase [Rhodospirillales bacterium]